ncbi:MAG: DoxX family protein [Gammaproteobacteria bacterium]|nr:DoxX family protein [Gammaproteobacteria bacterium]
MKDLFNQYVYILGRSLIGLFFLIPGSIKVLSFSQYIEILILNNVPFPAFSLVLVILSQLIFGTSIIFGKYIKLGSIILAINIVLFNYFIHDFWNFSDVVIQKHEMQNFIKNTAIIAGLLILYKTDESSS